MSAASKMLYTPLSIAISVAGGFLASKVFAEIWQRMSPSDQEPPEPKDLSRSTREALIAAAVQGLIFGLARASVDRATAKGYRALTDDDPQ